MIALPGSAPRGRQQGVFVDKRTGDGSRKSGRAPYVKLLARTIQSPYEIWSVPVELSGSPRQPCADPRFDVADTEMADCCVQSDAVAALDRSHGFVPKAGRRWPRSGATWMVSVWGRSLPGTIKNTGEVRAPRLATRLPIPPPGLGHAVMMDIR
ncbi:PBECR2 nuclease fold domain-containing protein [Desulfolutivibrio sulfodismutans]|uniref:PBECR2 nuclease fold domain-containing protein n=1 Tax=Desulfolutivibrio sulfodismutans TaxID=63561 RepID=UPI0035AC1AAC